MVLEVDADARVPDFQDEITILLGQEDFNLPFGCELERIREEVQHHLPKHGHVRDKGKVAAFPGQGKLHSFFFSLRLVEVHQFLDVGENINGFGIRVNLGGFDAGRGQEIVDEGRQVGSAVGNHQEVLGLLFRQGACVPRLEIIDSAADGMQRCSPGRG